MRKIFFGPILSLANSKVQDLMAEGCSHVWEMVSFFFSPMRFHDWRMIANWGCRMSSTKYSQKKVFTINLWVFYIILQPEVSGLGHLIKCTQLWLFPGNATLF